MRLFGDCWESTTNREAVGFMSMKNDPVQNAKRRVQQWLQEDGWTLTEQTSADVQWLFIAKRLEATLLFYQTVPAKDRIMLRAELTFENTERFLLLPLEKRGAAMYELCQLLAIANLEWAGLNLDIGKIEIYNSVYYDGLTKDTLMLRLRMLINGIIMTTNAVRRALDKPKAEPLN